MKPADRSMSTGASADADAPADAPPETKAPRRRLTFVGLDEDGPSDLSTNTDAYLAQGFGQSKPQHRSPVFPGGPRFPTRGNGPAGETRPLDD